MNDIQALLGASIKEFHDKENNATAKSASYLVGKNGLAYVLPMGDPTPFSCAIHVDTAQLQVVEGIYNSAFVSIDTQTDLFQTFIEKSSRKRTTVVCRFSSEGTITIPTGTRAGYPEVRTTEPANIPDGGGGVDVPCEAVEYSVDIPVGAIDTMITELEGVYVTNLVHGEKYAPTMILVYYRDFIIGINKTGTYNNVAKTFHYTGEIIQNRNKGFIIADDSILETLFLSNSTAKWMEFGTYCGIPCYPSFLTPANLESTYMIAEISQTDAIGMVSQGTDEQRSQNCKDQCRLHLMNATLDQAQRVASLLYEQAGEKGLFGVMDFPSWSQVQDDNQASFGVKSNHRVMNVRVNYVLESVAESALNYILDAAAMIAAV
jgi:hypothetical protein